MTPLDAARRYLALGLSVIPIPRPRPGVPAGQPGDGKVPAIAWKEFQTRLPAADELTTWFGGEPMNLAVVTGAVSGVVVVDVDSLEALPAATRRLKLHPLANPNRPRLSSLVSPFGGACPQSGAP